MNDSTSTPQVGPPVSNTSLDVDGNGNIAELATVDWATDVCQGWGFMCMRIFGRYICSCPYEGTDWRVKLAAAIHENKMYIIGGTATIESTEVAGMFFSFYSIQAYPQERNNS